MARSLDHPFYKTMAQLANRSMIGMSTFRANRYQNTMFSQADSYSNKNAAPYTAINKVEQWRRVLFNLLVPRTPQVMVSTKALSLRPTAAAFESALNHTMDEINFKRTMTYTVNDALMANFGMVKTGVAITPVNVMGAYGEMGRVYCDAIDFEDAVVDLKARRLDQMRFIGNRMTWTVRDAANFEPITERLRYLGQNGRLTTIACNPGGDPRIQTVSTGFDVLQAEDPYDQIELFELFLPYENEVVIYLGSGSGDVRLMEVLSVEDYDGPEGGPFDLLYYFEVNGNLMPSPPVAPIIQLHEAINITLETIIDQMESQKDVTVFPKGSDEDVAAFRAASNGSAIAINGNVKDMQVVKMAGANPVNFAALTFLLEQCDDLAGNIKAIAGLGAEADTARQEALIDKNSGRMIEYMATVTQDFMCHVLEKKIANLLWYKDNTPLALSKRVPQTQIEVPVVWDAREKEGDFLDYNFQFNMYAEQRMTPAIKAAKLQAYWQTNVLPTAQLAMQMGNPPNLMAYNRDMALFENMPEYEDLYMLGQPQPIIGGAEFIPSIKAPRQPYEHISRSAGPTPEAASRQRMGAFLDQAKSNANAGAV